MPSIRLSSSLDRQLENLALNTGITKTSHIKKAIIEYLANQGSNINSDVMNNYPAPYQRPISEGLLAAIADVIKMVEAGAVWTKNPETSNAKPTPGIYGINKPKGFYIDQDNNISILSVFLSPTLRPNVSRHQYDITPYDDWKKYMMEIE